MKKLLLITGLLSSSLLYAQDSVQLDPKLMTTNPDWALDSNGFISFPFPIEIYDGGPNIYSILPPTSDYWQEYPYWTIPMNFTITLAESNYNRKGAKRDIKKNKIQVLFPAGKKMKFTDLQDSLFQKKYGVAFYNQPKDHITHMENEKAYNQLIFAHLDEKYGQEWRFEMRNDAIGFEIPDSLIKKKALEIFAAVPPLDTRRLAKHVYKHRKITSNKALYVSISAAVPVLIGLFFVIRRRKRNVS